LPQSGQSWRERQKRELRWNRNRTIAHPLAPTPLGARLAATAIPSVFASALIGAIMGGHAQARFALSNMKPFPELPRWEGYGKIGQANKKRGTD
jgi:hypothetical protein